MLAMDPALWIEITERLGVPCAILMFLLIAFVGGAKWFAKRVVEPVVASHLDYIRTMKAHADREAGHTAKLQGRQEDTYAAVLGVRDDVAEVSASVKQVKGIVSRMHGAGRHRAEAPPPPGANPSDGGSVAAPAA